MPSETVQSTEKESEQVVVTLTYSRRHLEGIAQSYAMMRQEPSLPISTADLRAALDTGSQEPSELERLTKALHFYADHRNYEDGDNEEIPGWGEEDVNDEVVWTADGGWTARAALGIEEDDEHRDYYLRRIPAEVRDAIYAVLATQPSVGLDTGSQAPEQTTKDWLTDGERHRLRWAAQVVDDQVDGANFQAQIDSYTETAALLRRLADALPETTEGDEQRLLDDLEKERDRSEDRVTQLCREIRDCEADREQECIRADTEKKRADRLESDAAKAAGEVLRLATERDGRPEKCRHGYGSRTCAVCHRYTDAEVRDSLTKGSGEVVAVRERDEARSALLKATSEVPRLIEERDSLLSKEAVREKLLSSEALDAVARRQAQLTTAHERGEFHSKQEARELIEVALAALKEEDS